MTNTLLFPDDNDGLKFQQFLCPNCCQEKVNIHSAKINTAVWGRHSPQPVQAFLVASSGLSINASLLCNLREKRMCSYIRDTQQTHLVTVHVNVWQWALQKGVGWWSGKPGKEKRFCSVHHFYVLYTSTSLLQATNMTSMGLQNKWLLWANVSWIYIK